MRGSWQILQAAGLADALKPTAQPIGGLKAQNGVDTMCLPFLTDTLEIGQRDLPESEAELGSDTDFGYMVSADALHLALRDAIAETPNIDRVQGEFRDLKTDTTKTTLHISNDQTVSARLICACDGINSAVRTALDIGIETRDYKTTVFNFDAKISRPHDALAQQVFTKTGPCALLPLQGDRANFAWYVPTNSADFLSKLDMPALENEFNHTHKNWFGTVQILSERPVSYPLHMQIAQAITAPRAALLGTAARHVNPLVGQGLNIGFKDVAGLVETLETAQSLGSDIGSKAVLDRYKNIRWGDGTAWALGIDSLERMFAKRHLGAGLIRQIGMAAIANTAPLKTFLAKSTIGNAATPPQ